MHILLGLLVTIVTVLILLKRLADNGIDLAGLNPFLWRRRRNWRLQVEGDPVFAIEDPKDMAALLVVGVAKIDGEISAEEKHAIRSEFETTFSMSASDAAELLASSAYLLRDGEVLRSQLEAVLKRTHDRFTGEQIDSLFEMINRVALVDGTPTDMQVEFIASLRRQLMAARPQTTTWN